MANNAQNSGSFIPTTNVWDVSSFIDRKLDEEALKELLVRMYQNLNVMAISLNTRDAGFYVQDEFVCGQVYFPNPSLSSATSTRPTLRQVFRKVILFGALPNTGASSVAHNIPVDAGYSFTRIYAAASDQSGLKYLAIPYASASGADNIQLDVDATNVTITTASDRTAYTVCYVVLEYIKS